MQRLADRKDIQCGAVDGEYGRGEAVEGVKVQSREGLVKLVARVPSCEACCRL